MLTLFLFVLASSCGYAGGRIHQWYRTALERDAAWRDGYDQATGSLFALATRVVRRKPQESSVEVPLPTLTAIEDNVTNIADAPSAGRHNSESPRLAVWRQERRNQQAL